MVPQLEAVLSKLVSDIAGLIDGVSTGLDFKYTRPLPAQVIQIREEFTPLTTKDLGSSFLSQRAQVCLPQARQQKPPPKFTNSEPQTWHVPDIPIDSDVQILGPIRRHNLPNSCIKK